MTTAVDYPPIHIFRTGTFTAMSGATVEFGARELSQVVDTYDATKTPAPIVLGHPASNGPAEGWIGSVSFDGRHLFAHPSHVTPGLVDAVRARRYRKVSASFYPPSSIGNPTPGRWHLQHVGMLGAHPPAVKGLKPFSFGEPVELQGDALAPIAAFAVPAGYRVSQSDADLYRQALEMMADASGLSIIDAAKLGRQGAEASSFASGETGTAPIDATFRRAKLIQLRNPAHPWMTAYRAAQDEAEAAALADAEPTDPNLRLNLRAKQLQSINLDLSYREAIDAARRQIDATRAPGPAYS